MQATINGTTIEIRDFYEELVNTVDDSSTGSGEIETIEQIKLFVDPTDDNLSTLYSIGRARSVTELKVVDEESSTTIMDTTAYKYVRQVSRIYNDTSKKLDLGIVLVKDESDLG